jgi:hypothetical protein
MITPLLLTSLLYIGDSHSVGPFGLALNENLRQLNLSVVSYAYCGSIANDWYKTNGATKCGYLEIDSNGVKKSGTTGSVPQFKKLLEKHHPEIVIVELATNYFGYESDEFVVNDMRKMGKEIIDSGAQCFWVGMPTSRKLQTSHERLDRLTKEAIGDLCTHFDSFPVTSYPSVGGDGIHFYFPNGQKVASDWANAVFRSFKQTYQIP